MEKISLNDWELFGEGGTAFTYNNKSDPNIMLKLFKKAVPKGEAEKEFNMSKHVEEFGFDIPKAISIVEVEGDIGIIYERIKNKKSFSKMIANDIKNIDYCAKEMARVGKILHSTKTIPEYFKNHKDYIKEIIDKVDFSDEIINMLKKCVLTIPNENTCLHGDFQLGNFIDSNGKTYMIDLGGFSYGNHMFDIGALYFSCCVIITEKEKVDLFHISIEDLKKYFDAFAREYAKGEDIDLFYKKAKEYAALFAVFVYIMMGKPKEKKARYEEVIKELLGK